MSNKDKELFFKEKIISKQKLTSNVIQIKFPKPNNFTYFSGQFIQIKIPGHTPSILRSYSLSSQTSENFLKICIKLIPDGLGSNFFKKITKTKEIEFTPAQGNFIYKNSDKKNIYFIATGVGLSPIFSILKNELNNKNNKNIFLFFGVQTQKDIFWQKELEELKNKFKNFNFEIFLSQEENYNQFKKGHVTDNLENLDFDNSDFFVCGNPNMIIDVSKILLNKKVNINNIHFEIFE